MMHHFVSECEDYGISYPQVLHLDDAYDEWQRSCTSLQLMKAPSPSRGSWRAWYLTPTCAAGEFLRFHALQTVSRIAEARFRQRARALGAVARTAAAAFRRYMVRSKSAVWTLCGHGECQNWQRRASLRSLNYVYDWQTTADCLRD